jgi:hypothetical protein
MSMSHFLTLEDIRDICYVYAKAHLTYDEPLPFAQQQVAQNQLERTLRHRSYGRDISE